MIKTLGEGEVKGGLGDHPLWGVLGKGYVA